MTLQVQKPINEDTKEPEPSQIVEPAGGSTMSTPSVEAHPKTNQQLIVSIQPSADAS